jgi:Lysylphosphatidylglycerol synthase TM region
MGGGLLGYLINRLGAVTDNLRAVGWGMVLILALAGIFHLVRACAWRLTFRSDVAGASIARLFRLRLISEAASTFGLAGQMVGEGLRVSLLGPVIPMPDRISSVALDRAIFIVSSGTVGITGTIAAVLLLHLKGPWRVYAFAFAGTLGVMLVLAGVTFARGWHICSCLLRPLRRLPWARQRIAKSTSLIEAAEDNLLSFHSRDPKSFRMVIALHVMSQMLSIAEVYLLLRFMGVGIMPLGAFIVEGFTKLVNIVGALNPGNIGTYEGGNLLVARLLGFPAAAGLTLALCRRARTLFWAGVGAVCLTLWPRATSGDVHIRRVGAQEAVQLASVTSDTGQVPSILRVEHHAGA